jgi:phthalate 4,5-dioxygenase oxygenase subunit
MTPQDHELLSRTGPGTVMGTYLRRYWTAALLSSELPEPDGAPVKVRLLGEDLIAFRDTQGRVGLVDAHCSHRGAPLYFGRNAEGGLRCSFHGWKYDVDGNCVDMPNELPEHRFNEKVKHTAYPCVERNGVVWTYMGPSDAMPPMPELEWLTVPSSHVYVSKVLRHCHWTQGMEGDLDSVHVGFLHQEVFKKRAQTLNHESAKWLVENLTPREEIVPTPAGCLHATYRDVDGGRRYWKIGQWFFPWFTTIPGFVGDGPLGGHAWVPVDDQRCWVFAFSWHPTRPLTAQELSGKSAVAAFHAQRIAGTAFAACNEGNDYAGPDAPPARQPWMRITDVQAQDMAMTEGMGFLYDRTKEHMGRSDRLVVLTRRRLVEAAESLQRGEQPPGMNPKDYRQRPISIVLPGDVPSWTDAVAEAIDTRPETFRASA